VDVVEPESFGPGAVLLDVRALFGRLAQVDDRLEAVGLQALERRRVRGAAARDHGIDLREIGDAGAFHFLLGADCGDAAHYDREYK
jgi:hypothetical protein